MNHSSAARAWARAAHARAGQWLGAALVVACGAVSAADSATVDTVTVEQRRWQQTVPLYGTLTSPRDAELTPRVAGLVDAVEVDAGDRVARGDTLVVLDHTLEALNLDTLRASQAEAEARLAEARRLEREADRLAERGAVSSTELEARRSQVAVAAAAVRRLRAEVAHQRERLQRHRVIAPFDGVIRERWVEPGEYVAQTTPVVALVATDVLRMDVAAPQQYYGLIAPGMGVRIQPESLSPRTIAADVDVIVPASDATARSFLVRVFVDNADARLTPGMSARVLFDIETPEPVLVAPRDALVRVPGGGTRMWVIEPAGDSEAPTAVRRQVTIGRGANGLVEVRSGLAAGERVVVRGNESLEAGQPVRVRRAHGALAPESAAQAAKRVAPARAGPGAARSLRLSEPGPER